MLKLLENGVSNLHTGRISEVENWEFLPSDVGTLLPDSSEPENMRVFAKYTQNPIILRKNHVNF